MLKLIGLKNTLVLNIVFHMCLFAVIQIIFALSGMDELTTISVLKFGAIGGALGAVKYYWSKNENDDPAGKKKAKPVE